MSSQVLVIDDDPAFRKLVGVHLARAGYRVVDVFNGPDGLEALRRQVARIAFVDYDMPGMNGVEFCRQVRADTSFPFTHLVILTAHVDPKLTIAALDAGASDFMNKPFHHGELLARLRAGERTIRLSDDAASVIRLESERNHLRDAVSAMERVLGVVSHELRTPIAALGIMSDYVLNPAARNTPECEKFLIQMNQTIRGMSQTVNDLLEAARLNSGKARWNWSEFEVEPLCREVMQEIAPLALSKEIELSVEADPACGRMMGDEAAVRRLLVNLLSNSCKHTATGSIRIDAQRHQRDGFEWIELRVIDTGQGISPEILSRLGEAFVLNSGIVGANHVSGTGLGVAICKRIVEAHGGMLKVSSTEGQGTCVAAVIRADLTEPVTSEPPNTDDSEAAVSAAVMDDEGGR